MLSAAYRTYLQNGATRGAAPPLVDALCRAGLDVEGLLLHVFATSGPGRYQRGFGSSRFPSALGTSRVVYLSTTPPPAERGELWFDTCDLSLMLLVGDEHDEAWIALHPVARFQIAAFLALATIDRGAAPGALDASRLLAGDEADPVSHCSTSEAELYLHWVSKRFAGERDHWKAFKAHDLDLWTVPAKEWVGSEEPDDEHGYAVTMETLGDMLEELDDPDDPFRAVYRRDELADGVTFRVALSIEDLARQGGPTSRLGECGARVLDRLTRVKGPGPARAHR